MKNAFQFLLVSLVLISFGTKGQEQNGLAGLPDDPNALPNFDGAWQKDYRRSDNLEQVLNYRINQIRNSVERSRGNGADAPTVRVENQSRGGNTIVDLARFAELISRHNDIYISHNQERIVIRRDGEADLICDTASAPVYTFSDQFGYEACGWVAGQLIFKIGLPGEIAVIYRFAVSEDRSTLSLQTRISSHETLTFDLDEYFLRYEKPEEQYHCEQTLSRGRVCSMNGS